MYRYVVYYSESLGFCLGRKVDGIEAYLNKKNIWVAHAGDSWHKQFKELFTRMKKLGIFNESKSHLVVDMDIHYRSTAHE